MAKCETNEYGVYISNNKRCYTKNVFEKWQAGLHDGRIQDFFKEGVDTSRGVRGHALLGKCFISNALKRYFLTLRGFLTVDAGGFLTLQFARDFIDLKRWLFSFHEGTVHLFVVFFPQLLTCSDKNRLYSRSHYIFTFFTWKWHTV